MKKVFLTIMVLFLTSLISCEKDETPVLNSSTKDNFKQCRGCSGTWDITDSIPE